MCPLLRLIRSPHTLAAPISLTHTFSHLSPPSSLRRLVASLVQTCSSEATLRGMAAEAVADDDGLAVALAALAPPSAGG
eukprot:6755386-Lingulodinium_polyedra.AAC.1